MRVCVGGGAGKDATFQIKRIPDSVKKPITNFRHQQPATPLSSDSVKLGELLEATDYGNE